MKDLKEEVIEMIGRLDPEQLVALHQFLDQLQGPSESPSREPARDPAE